jgi:hypothetical protein
MPTLNGVKDMPRRPVVRICSILLIGALLAGCSSAQKSRAPSNPDPLIKGEVTEEKARRALEMKLTRQMEYLEQNKQNFKSRVVSLPAEEVKYHYKYYDEFPEGPEGLDIDIESLETFSPSFKGEAKYRKIRYQTRYTTSKGRAAKDTDFIRDEGMQTEVYEFDGEKWAVKRSIFEVRNTSVYGEDRWRATRGRIRRVEGDEPELFVDKIRNLFGFGN